MHIREKFKSNKTQFIPFIMAGYPTHDASLQSLIDLAEAGADIIEFGVPFSDPMADGVVNQNAAETALKNGTSLNTCLSIVETFRGKGHDTPIVLFSYFNPIFKMGLSTFSKKAKQAGVNAVLVVDLPVEELPPLYDALQAQQLGIILLASPTTTKERLTTYTRFEFEFIYYISRLGVTGVQENLSQNLQQEISDLKSVLPEFPICVGFGIANPEQARIVAQFAEGVIVGSALVARLHPSQTRDDSLSFKAFAKTFSDAVKG